jgi:hypothetical protein
MTVNDELERRTNEGVAAYFVTLSEHMPEDIDE